MTVALLTLAIVASTASAARVDDDNMPGDYPVEGGELPQKVPNGWGELGYLHTPAPTPMTDLPLQHPLPQLPEPTESPTPEPTEDSHQAWRIAQAKKANEEKVHKAVENSMRMITESEINARKMVVDAQTQAAKHARLGEIAAKIMVDTSASGSRALIKESSEAATAAIAASAGDMAAGHQLHQEVTGEHALSVKSATAESKNMVDKAELMHCEKVQKGKSEAADMVLAEKVQIASKLDEIHKAQTKRISEVKKELNEKLVDAKAEAVAKVATHRVQVEQDIAKAKEAIGREAASVAELKLASLKDAAAAIAASREESKAAEAHALKVADERSEEAAIAVAKRVAAHKAQMDETISAAKSAQAIAEVKADNDVAAAAEKKDEIERTQIEEEKAQKRRTEQLAAAKKAAEDVAVSTSEKLKKIENANVFIIDADRINSKAQKAVDAADIARAEAEEAATAPLQQQQ